MIEAARRLMSGCCIIRMDETSCEIEALRFIAPRIAIADDFSLLTHFRAPPRRQVRARADHGEAE